MHGRSRVSETFVRFHGRGHAWRSPVATWRALRGFLSRPFPGGCAMIPGGQRIRSDEFASPLHSSVMSRVRRGGHFASGHPRRIGLLVTDLDNQFYAHIIAPVHQELERLGYQLMLHTESVDNETVAERLISNGLDGVILATTTVDSVAPLRLRDRGLPFIYFNRTASFVPADATTAAPTAGFVAAATAVRDLGHTRIGAVLGPS